MRMPASLPAAKASSAAKAALLASGLLCLAACQAAPPLAAAAPPGIRFEVTDRSDPHHIIALPARDGGVLDVPALFDLQVDVVGTDPRGARALLIRTSSYTPSCNNAPVQERYRTKLIALPPGVTAVPATPTRLTYRLPLSAATLASLGLCTARMPVTGSVHLHAQLVDAAQFRSRADLIIRVGHGALQTSG